MEKNVIINKIAEKKIYRIEKCIKIAEDSCNLVLSEASCKVIREWLPSEIVSSLLKKNGWLDKLFLGHDYCSQYRMDILPYYDGSWKDFIWRDYIDNRLFLQDNHYPKKVLDFLDSYDSMQQTFSEKLKEYLNSFPKRSAGMLSSLMKIYWNVLSRRYYNKMDILNQLYPFLVTIHYDERGDDSVDKPLSVTKYLYNAQQTSAGNLDYAELARNYFQNIYNYLRLCYHADLEALNDMCGDCENVFEDTHLMEYESFLLFFDAIEYVISCMEDK